MKQWRIPTQDLLEIFIFSTNEFRIKLNNLLIIQINRLQIKLTLCTRGALGAAKSSRTLAVNLMIDHDTLGRLPTGVRQRAGVHTVAVVAGLLSRAVHIGPAVDGKAGHLGVAGEPRRA